MGVAPAAPLALPGRFVSCPLPVWPLKARWLKTVSLAEPGVRPLLQERSSWAGRMPAAAFRCLVPLLASLVASASPGLCAPRLVLCCCLKPVSVAL